MLFGGNAPGAGLLSRGVAAKNPLSLGEQIKARKTAAVMSQGVQRAASPLGGLLGSSAPVRGFELGNDEALPVSETPAQGLPQLPVATPPQGGPLGNSMRQPFDYEAALKTLQGEQWKPKWWQVGMAAVGDALSGSGPIATQALASRRDASRSRMQSAQDQVLKWRHDDFTAQRDADLRAAAPFTSGRDRLSYDPATGQAQMIYDGPEDFETYADTLGLQPGTPEYFKAVEDHVLRGNGPTAHGRDLELDDHRTANDRSLEAFRYGNRVGLENLRQGNRTGLVDYRNANPAPQRPRLSSSGSLRPQVVSVKTPSEASKLKPGQLYKGPDGVVRER